MSTLFDINRIDEYQIEVTTNCNAACPQCPRNIQGSGINPHLPLTNLARSVLDQRFDRGLVSRLRQVFFCGSYGDPIVHPDFLDILRDFRDKSPTTWLYFHTNGGAHAPDWWQEVARIMSGHGQIDFGIDGIGATLSRYRRFVDYNRVIENARAFIQAGGRAQWNFIVFRHNESQVSQARDIANQLGFYKFLPRRTGRFWHHGEERELESWPVLDRTGRIEYELEPPTQPEWRNPSTQRISWIREQHGTFQNYLAHTKITCDAAQGRKVAITAQGLVMPCNFFTHNLYDLRFHDTAALPGSHAVSFDHGHNQVAEFVRRYWGELDIHENSLSDVFQSRFWQELEHSWTGPSRVWECAMTCGERFTKVWDQGGNNK